MLTLLKFGYHYTVIVYITCGRTWLLFSGYVCLGKGIRLEKDVELLKDGRR